MTDVLLRIDGDDSSGEVLCEFYDDTFPELQDLILKLGVHVMIKQTPTRSRRRHLWC